MAIDPTAILGPDSGSCTPDVLARRQAIAQKLYFDAAKTRPYRTWLEGVGDLANTGVYAAAMKQGNDLESGGQKAIAQALLGGPQIGPTAGGMGPQAPMPSPPMASNTLGNVDDGQTGNMQQYGKSIAGIESGGRYNLLGPTTNSGDRAYGKYQVMGNNIPSWTQEILGQKMTPQEFLNDPAAQEKVFAGKFGQSVQKYGNPQDAASVWFTGRPAAQGANSSDVLGTTGRSYVNQFNAGLRQPPQASPGGALPSPDAPPVQMASLGGDVPQGAPPIPGRDTLTPQDQAIAPPGANNPAIAAALGQQGVIGAVPPPQPDRAAIAGALNPQASPQNVPQPPVQMAQAQQAPGPQGQPQSQQLPPQVVQMLQHPNPYVRQRGIDLASKLQEQQLAPPELKMITNAMGGQDPYSWQGGKLTPIQTPGGTPGTTQSGDPQELTASYESKYPGVANRVEQLYRGEGGMPNKRTNPLDGPALSLIQQTHPDWNMAHWSEKNKLITGLGQTSPTSPGGRIQAAQNAFDHLANASDTAIEKGNMDLGISGLSTIGNKIQSSTTAQKDLQSKLERQAVTYGSERTKFLTGAEGTEGERQAFLHSLGPDSAAPAQMAGTIEGEYTQMRDALHTQEATIRDKLGDAYLEKHPVITPKVKESMDRIERNIIALRTGKKTDTQPQGNAPQGAAPAAGGVVKWERKPDGSLGPVQ